jgi:hypothetical protein
MNGCADGLHADETEQPGDEKNYRQDEQHDILPVRDDSRERAGFQNGCG